MTQPFPNEPYLTGYYEPFRAELEADDLVIEGKLPEDLHGSFYRNGPDPQFPPHPDDKYHVFDGDGMIYAFHFKGGKVSMRNRWVRTLKFNMERQEGRRLFGVFGNPRFNDPSVNPMMYNTANTHIWPHADKLLALMEGAPATSLHPETLETLGFETYENQAAGPFTAHPKTDPVTGELFAFGYMAKGPMDPTAIRYNVIDKAGKPVRQAWLNQPYTSMMHDMMLTEHFVVFPCLPVAIDYNRAMQGKPPACWEQDKASYFGIMPRYGNSDEVTWIEADPNFMFHISNAHEHGGDIVVEVAGSKRAPLMPDLNGDLPRHEDTRFTLKRWIIPRGNGGAKVREEELDTIDMQFPRIDDRVNGRPYSQVYYNASTSPTAGRVDGFDALCVFDLKAGKRRQWSGGEGTFIGEPVFVPRAGSTEEGDGYLLTLAWSAKTNRSELLVFNARDVEGGPVARVRAPARVPGGFHCHWRQAA
jgi:carotenoid cleavage dioxygenase-like enzyme